MQRTIVTIVLVLVTMAGCDSDESRDGEAVHGGDKAMHQGHIVGLDPGDDVTGQAATSSTSNLDGPIGEAQQKLGPISFLMCGLFAGGTALYTRYALCPHATTEEDRSNCNDVGLWGGVGIGILCSLPF
jgi:hypothetical protein